MCTVCPYYFYFQRVFSHTYTTFVQGRSCQRVGVYLAVSCWIYGILVCRHSELTVADPRHDSRADPHDGKSGRCAIASMLWRVVAPPPATPRCPRLPPRACDANSMLILEFSRFRERCKKNPSGCMSLLSRLLNCICGYTGDTPNVRRLAASGSCFDSRYVRKIVVYRVVAPLLKLPVVPVPTDAHRVRGM